MWHGRHGSSCVVSIVAAIGLSGAQCHALVGPKIGFGLIHGEESIEVISELGLILLLYIIGLEMNLKALLSSGKQLLVAGFGQFPLGALAGIGLFWGLMGYGLKGNNSDGLYLALMCGLSSTADQLNGGS